MARYFIGIDIGTGETRGALIDETCRVVASEAVRHNVSNPKPGWFEMDPETEWWPEFCQVSHSLIEKAGISPDQIGCVGLSCMGCDCIPVDAESTALSKAILYGVDSRATGEMAELAQMLGDRAEEVMGHEICTSDIAPKIMWFKNNMPEVWAAADKFLTGSSYLCAKLTGEFTIDVYLAEEFMPCYDGTTWEVDEAGCTGICRPDQMARVMHATDIAGTVTARAAAETGLAEGTPVLVGTGDSGAEAISTGIFQPGDIMVQLGSTAFFVCMTEALVNEPRLWPGTFIIPGTYSLCAGTNTAGALTKWLRDVAYQDAKAAEEAGGPNAFAVMAEEAASVPAGAEGLVCLPYLAGERTPINDPEARGMFFGLTTNHTRAHLSRAAIEGISCTIAQHFDVIAENGVQLKKVMCAGGGTKNEVWLQCVADMIERPVAVSEVTIGSAYGDALMATLGGGAFSSWAELDEAVKPARVYEPNPDNFATYRALRDRFRRLYEANKEIMHER